jgi:hypothetical protein
MEFMVEEAQSAGEEMSDIEAEETENEIDWTGWRLFV